MVSTITSTEVYKHISPKVWNNITNVLIHRFRIYYWRGECDLWKKALLQMYHGAVSEPYSFLYKFDDGGQQRCSCKDSEKYLIPNISDN